MSISLSAWAFDGERCWAADRHWQAASGTITSRKASVGLRPRFRRFLTTVRLARTAHRPRAGLAVLSDRSAGQQAAISEVG